MMILQSGTAKKHILSAHWKEISTDHTRAYETNELHIDVFQTVEDCEILAARLVVTMPGHGEGTIKITYYSLSSGKVVQEEEEAMSSLLVHASETTWAHIALDAVGNN